MTDEHRNALGMKLPCAAAWRPPRREGQPPDLTALPVHAINTTIGAGLRFVAVGLLRSDVHAWEDARPNVFEDD